MPTDDMAGKLGAIADAMTGFAKRFDDFGKRLDALEKRDNVACDDDRSARDDDDYKRDDKRRRRDRRDDEREKEEGGDQPEPLSSDDKRRDDSHRADAAVVFDNEADRLAASFQAWDRTATLHGERAHRPMDGERLVTFEKRNAKRWQKFSPTWKDKDLGILEPRVLLDIVSPQVRNDAVAAAYDPTNAINLVGEREFREIDPLTGRVMVKFAGRFSDIFAPFMRPRQLAKDCMANWRTMSEKAAEHERFAALLRGRQ